MGGKSDTEECGGCGREIAGDPGQCPGCGKFLNRGRLVRWFAGTVVALGLVTALILAG